MAQHEEAVGEAELVEHLEDGRMQRIAAKRPLKVAVRFQ